MLTPLDPLEGHPTTRPLRLQPLPLRAPYRRCDDLLHLLSWLQSPENAFWLLRLPRHLDPASYLGNRSAKCRARSNRYGITRKARKGDRTIDSNTLAGSVLRARAGLPAEGAATAVETTSRSLRSSLVGSAHQSYGCGRRK